MGHSSIGMAVPHHAVHGKQFQVVDVLTAAQLVDVDLDRTRRCDELPAITKLLPRQKSWPEALSVNDTALRSNFLRSAEKPFGAFRVIGSSTLLTT